MCERRRQCWRDNRKKTREEIPKREQVTYPKAQLETQSLVIKFGGIGLLFLFLIDGFNYIENNTVSLNIDYKQYCVYFYAFLMKYAHFNVLFRQEEELFLELSMMDEYYWFSLQ